MGFPVEKGVESTADLQLARIIRLQPLSADPTDAANGDIWYRDDLKKYRIRENGVNKTVTAV